MTKIFLPAATSQLKSVLSPPNGARTLPSAR